MISKYALDYEAQTYVQFGTRIYKGFGASWQLMYQNRTGNYLDINGATMASPVWLFDGRIYWKKSDELMFLWKAKAICRRTITIMAALSSRTLHKSRYLR